jgi:hypothetical protein
MDYKTAVFQFSTTLCFILAFSISGFCQPDIPIDTALKSNADCWKIKVIQNGMSGKRPAKVSFGPVETTGSEYEKVLTDKNEVEKGLIWKNIHDVKSRETTMKLLLNSTDSVSVQMISVREETQNQRSAFAVMTKSGEDGDQKYQENSYIEEMNLQFMADGSCWYFTKTDSGGATVIATLQDIRDSSIKLFIYRVNNLEGKKPTEIAFKQPAFGYVFKIQEKQVAAFQTIFKEKAWVSKTLDARLKEAVIATIAAMMATIKAANTMGY